jgi:hypothetical protein
MSIFDSDNPSKSNISVSPYFLDFIFSAAFTGARCPPPVFRYKKRYFPRAAIFGWLPLLK